MGIIAWIIIITFIAGVCGTGLGGAVAAMFKEDSDKAVSLLLSFAGGVMLSVVCFDLIFDALKTNGEINGKNLYIVIIGMLLGYGIIFILNHLIDKRSNREVAHIDSNHPKTADDLDELIHSDHYDHHKSGSSKAQLFVAGIVMASAIALHNLPEGMVIGASFVGAAGTLTKGGILMAIVIGLHNIPEGMAVSAPLISGGMKKTKAIFVTGMSGAPTIIGALIGYYIGNMSEFSLSASLSFASGAMLYVVFGELLPESILMWRSKLPAFVTLIGVIVGMLIIFA